MVRISGIDLPKSKRIEYALTSVYGIGLTSSRNILSTANVDPDKTYECTWGIQKLWQYVK